MWAESGSKSGAAIGTSSLDVARQPKIKCHNLLVDEITWQSQSLL